MADLPDEIKAVLTAACNLTDVSGLAIIDGPETATSHLVTLKFQTQLAAGTMRRALVALEQAVVAWGEWKPTTPEPALLESIPTKPLDVEVRQWALALVMQVYGAPFSGPTMQARESAANVFVQYAITGAMPAHATGPEDAA